MEAISAKLGESVHWWVISGGMRASRPWSCEPTPWPPPTPSLRARDPPAAPVRVRGRAKGEEERESARGREGGREGAVSYTHLTLPTIC
eukprot:870048-Rhodomonas_salina.1